MQSDISDAASAENEITKDERLTQFLLSDTVTTALVCLAACISESLEDKHHAIGAWEDLRIKFVVALADLTTDETLSMALLESDKGERSEYSPERGFSTEHVVSNLKKNILKTLRELKEEVAAKEQSNAWSNYEALLRAAGPRSRIAKHTSASCQPGVAQVGLKILG